MPPDVRIYAYREVIDHLWVFEQLKASYWGGHYTPEGLMNAMEHSVCISAIKDDRRQVGFLRIITDRAIVSHLTDVIVDEKFRHQGIATAMLTKAFEHPWVKKTLCLCQTRYAYPLYAKFGFVMGGDVLKRNPA